MRDGRITNLWNMMMHPAIFVLPALVALAACQPAQLATRPAAPSPQTGASAAAPAAAPAAAKVVKAPAPPAGARTADALDTTTAAQKAAAVQKPASGETRLGETIGSLGDATEPGLWIKTPLASVRGAGRIEHKASGKSALVELIPLDGPKTAGSEVSLAAMRLLGVGLTDLPDLDVYAQ